MMHSYFILHSFFFVAFAIKDQIDVLNSNSNALLEYNILTENTSKVEQKKSKSSKYSPLKNIVEEDLLELMLSPELVPFMIEEFKGKHVIRKSRKQVNTTTKNELQYVKKKFIYRGNFLTFCSISFAMYLILIFSIQVWILISRIEIKNGNWSISPAEKTSWWFDQVEFLGEELI